MPVPYTFGTATTSIPLSNLDANFNTPVTIGNATVGLGNTVTTVGNLTLTNATISSGNVTVTTGVFGAGSNTAPAITTTGDTNTGIFFPAADTIAFTEGGVEAMRIDSSGNLGIGTSSPATKAEISGTAASANIALRITNTDASGYSTLQLGDANAGVYRNGSSQSGYAGASSLNLITVGAHNIGFSTQNTLRAIIDSSGNVGIGTSSPTSLSGTTLQVQNSTVGAILWSDGTRTGELLASVAAGVTVGSRSNHSLQFVTNDTPRMSIDTSGNIAASNAIMTIGDNTRTASSSTTTGAIVCGGGLGVWSNINAGGSGNFSNTISAFSQSPSSSQQGVLLRNTFNVGGSIFSTGAATTNDFILWVGGSGTQGAITGNGAGINYSSASDYRLKENVAPMTNALGVVAQLKPCTYTWKFDGSAGQGFIAHELQEVFPDAVTGKKDDVETYTDEDGNEQTRIKPQGVDASFLVAALTAAIQELKAELDATKAEVQALKGN